MSDIVDRLQKWSIIGYGHDASLDMKEDADEIERLRAALREISERHVPDQPSCLDIDEADYVRRQHTDLRRIARAALEGKYE